MPKPIKTNKLKVTQYEGANALTIDQAKELIGWEASDKGAVLRDTDGKNIALTNNATNRPFRPGLSKRYRLEILRRKWFLNGEPLIFDDKGKCQSGQHRLVAFIMACEEWKKEKSKWSKYWKKEPTFECLVVEGISSADEVVNTIDQGQKRTFGDVIYRSELFHSGVSLGEGKETIKLPDLGNKQRQKLSNILAGAARLTWLRVTDKKVSDAPHFPLSEGMDFIEQHPGLLYAVAFIYQQEGGEKKDGEKISGFISLAYAAGLFYLMSASGTDPDEFAESGTEALDFSMQKKAQGFWSSLAKGTDLKETDPVYVCRELLRKMDAGSAAARDEIVATVVNAFNCYAEGKKVKTKDIQVRMGMVDGREIVADMPRLGGIDVEGPEAPTTKTEVDEQEESDDREGSRSKRGKWTEGDTAWVKDNEGKHWFGTVKEVYPGEGKGDEGIIILESDSGEEWEERPSRLSLKYPA